MSKVTASTSCIEAGALLLHEPPLSLPSLLVRADMYVELELLPSSWEQLLLSTTITRRYSGITRYSYVAR